MFYVFSKRRFWTSLPRDYYGNVPRIWEFCRFILNVLECSPTFPNRRFLTSLRQDGYNKVSHLQVLWFSIESSRMFHDLPKRRFWTSPQRDSYGNVPHLEFRTSMRCFRMFYEILEMSIFDIFSARRLGQCATPRSS